MNKSFRLQQELVFLLKSKAILSALLLLLLVSAGSVTLGLAYVAEERQQIAELIEMDREERSYKRTLAVDFGGAAYDAFHAVWNEPSDLAFAAIGQRDLTPTMMRIRALAIEGQVYETDSINPELALAGRFDFSFVSAYLMPLIIIFVFYDLFAAERESGRLNLLTVSARNRFSVWLPRLSLRLLGILFAVLLPFWIAMIVEGTSVGRAAQASFAILLQAVFWTLLTLLIATRPTFRSETIASLSIGAWVFLTLVVPIAAKVYIESSVTGVKGSEVALLQRESVNDAWDLPISHTMEAFYASHPEWADSPPITGVWHWKWYYAFQQVGDETARELAREYRQAMLSRDALTAAFSWVSPAVAVQRRLEALAKTNLVASLEFEDQVRQYHSEIRRAYYPVLFREVPFNSERLAEIVIPEFSSTEETGD